MEIISSHSMAKCESFAQVMLNDNLVVAKLKRDSDGKTAVFIKEVLNEWVSSKEDQPAEECTWEILLDCMNKVNMDGLSIKKIRDVLLQLPTGKAYKMIRCYIRHVSVKRLTP